MKWYKETVGYEIYPYSFMDANGDGYGDLRGVIEKLDYLVKLGIGLIWLCPVFDSPLEDYGYDVSDFYQVNPLLGTNGDLEELIEQAHKRGIRVILDLVLNHVSAAHEWFKKALETPDGPYHDYFIFRKPVMKDGKKQPPNNWMGFFSESVWTYVPALDEYYFHLFSEHMPDLNWENPALREEMYRVARHYLDLGADGFRLDAVAHLSKDTSFADCPGSGLVLDTSKFSNRERLFDYLAEFRHEVTDRYEDVLTVGEVGGEVSTEGAIRYADRKKGSLTMVFNFDTCWENGAFGSVMKKDEEIVTDVVNLKALFKKWYEQCHARCDMPLYWMNHDHPRVVSQYGSEKYHDRSAKMLATVLLFLYGTPFLYQGEELGMTNVDYTAAEDFRPDVGSWNFVKSHPEIPRDVMLRFLRRTSRLNARTPMQWTGGRYAGFSAVPPYIRVNGNHTVINAEAEDKDPASVLNHYRKAVALRKALNGIVVNGDLTFLEEKDPDLMIYAHRLGNEVLTVVANFREKERSVRIGAGQECLLSNVPYEPEGGELKVPAFGCFLLKKLEKNVN